MLKKIDFETLQYIKWFIFGVLVVDIIGLYWYLRWFKLAYAVLMVCMIALFTVLMLERGKDKIMGKAKDKIHELEEQIKDLRKDDEIEEMQEKIDKMKEQRNKKGKKENDKEDSNNDDSDFGLPDPDEYNERLNKSYNTFGL